MGGTSEPPGHAAQLHPPMQDLIEAWTVPFSEEFKSTPKVRLVELALVESKVCRWGMGGLGFFWGGVGGESGESRVPGCL